MFLLSLFIVVLFIILSVNGFLNTFRISLNMTVLTLCLHPSVFPITRILSSTPFLYSDERKKLYPNYKNEKSFEVYSKRLKGMLISYSNREKMCFEENKEECLSYNRKESIYAIKKYSEKDLHLQIPDQVNILIESKSCEEIGIVVGIVTAPFQFAERYAIRNTWCNESYHNIKGVKCYFYSGITSNSNDNSFLKQEASLFDDIIQFDIADTYLNLTIIQLQSYNWILNHCPSMKYYVRTDADMYVNLNVVVNQIIPSLPTSFAYGHVFRGAKPFRDPNHKYYLPPSVYSETYFPPFISGCMCVLSRDVLQTLVEGSNYVRPIHYLDDAYYGQIMDRYGVLIVEDKKLISVIQLSLNEVVNRSYAAVHRYSPVDLIVIDSFLKRK